MLTKPWVERQNGETKWTRAKVRCANLSVIKVQASEVHASATELSQAECKLGTFVHLRLRFPAI